MIYGIGIDIVEVNRLRDASDKWGKKFFEKILTDSEIEYCYKMSDPYPSLAVRFAAKEAFIKAIGGAVPITMKDIEVVKDDRGRPSLDVKGKLKAFLTDQLVTTSHLSLSHEKEYGVACVVLET